MAASLFLTAEQYLKKKTKKHKNRLWVALCIREKRFMHENVLIALSREEDLAQALMQM